jgi:hypothetical protein
MPFVPFETISESSLRALFYGPPGVGKTYLCGTAAQVPALLPILWVEVDGGIIAARQVLGTAGKRLKVLTVESVQDLNLITEAVTNARSPFKTMIIDSLTEMYAVMMQIHLATLGRAGQAPQLQDYGAISGRLLSLFREVKRRRNLTFLCTAGEQYATNEVTGEQRTMPDITGKMSQQAPAFFHICGYLHADVEADGRGKLQGITRNLQVQPFRNVYAKDRTPGSSLGLMVEAPTMTKLYASYTQAVELHGEEEPGDEEVETLVEERADAEAREVVEALMTVDVEDHTGEDSNNG